ncbi:hypothetical protein ACLOJK_038981, partial [Asimina triloba]
ARRWPVVVSRVAGSAIPSFPLFLFPSFPFPPCLLYLASPAVSPLRARARASARASRSASPVPSHCCPARARLLCLTSPATSSPPATLLCLATRQSPLLPCLLCLAVADRHQGRCHKLK